MIALFRSLFAPPRHLILVLVALWIGLALSEKRADRHSISRDMLNNLVYSSLFVYIVSGRVLFALANYSAFAASPLSLFSINIDLFDPTGALITALLVGFVYGQGQKLRWWSILDALTPLFAVLAIGLSLSHLAAGTAFGSPTDMPWGISLWNTRRHPTQIYELISAIFIFMMIWFRESKSPPRSTFLIFAALTAASRLFLEAFRGDSTLVFGGLRLAQIVAWVVLALALMAVEFTQQVDKTD